MTTTQRPSSPSTKKATKKKPEKPPKKPAKKAAKKPAKKAPKKTSKKPADKAPKKTSTKATKTTKKPTKKPAGRAPKKTSTKTTKPAKKPVGKAPKKERASARTWTPPAERDRIEDVRIEQGILFNGPWDLEPVTPSAKMTAAYLAQLGASCFRRGDRLAAEAAWALIPESDEIAKTVRPWRALALAQRGELPAALGLAPEGSHLRGEILCALGQHEAGLALIAKNREDDEQAEWRLLREAVWLRRTGRGREAAEKIEARLKKIARFTLRLRVEALRGWLAAGSPDKARKQLKDIAQSAPGLARSLEGRSLEGLDSLPHGLSALAKEAHEAGLGVHFLDRASAAAFEKQLSTGETAPLGVLPGPTTWSALGEGTQYVVVAESSLRPARTAYSGLDVALWLAHPDRPGKLYLCLNTSIPAFLWPELDADLAALTRWAGLVGERLSVDEPRVFDLPRRLRLFIGASAVPSPYSGELEELDFHTFARVAVSSPFLESYGWGGEHAEDPHRYFVDRGGLDGMLALRRTAGQDPQRPPMESYRTKHSRSIFTLELHRAGWVIDVRYLPSWEPAHTAAFNARFGTRFPAELPLDCVGLLMHFHPALTLDELKASVVPGLPPEELWRIYAVGALWHESVALDAWLAQLPPELAKNGDEVAWIYNHLGYLLKRNLELSDLQAPLQTGPFVSAMLPPEMPADEEDDEEDDDEEDA